MTGEPKLMVNSHERQVRDLQGDTVVAVLGLTYSESETAHPELSFAHP